MTNFKAAAKAAGFFASTASDGTFRIAATGKRHHAQIIAFAASQGFEAAAALPGASYPMLVRIAPRDSVMGILNSWTRL